jgi:hypothetical protein
MIYFVVAFKQLNKKSSKNDFVALGIALADIQLHDALTNFQQQLELTERNAVIDGLVSFCSH